MVNGISNSGINQLQLLRANQAFKATNAANKSLQEDNIEDLAELAQNTPQSETKLAVNNSVNPKIQQMTDELNQFMSQYSNNELSSQDVGYALRFGRSVLVNYSA